MVLLENADCLFVIFCYSFLLLCDLLTELLSHLLVQIYIGMTNGKLKYFSVLVVEE
jgi:hypothetical protein